MSPFQKVLEIANNVRKNDTKEFEIEKKRTEWVASLRRDAMKADLLIAAETNSHLRNRLIKKGVL